MGRRWKHLRPDKSPEFLARLPRGNIGVALGQASGGLCAIDCDVDGFYADLVDASPWLVGTLSTKGSRGCVFWLRIDGQYPPTTKLKTRAGDVGEWRATGAQSIVWGIHPSGQPYQFIAKRPAVRIDYSKITWPDAVIDPPLYRDTDVVCSASLPLSLSVKSLEEAVLLCVPSVVHANNTALFRLARAIKGMSGDPTELRTQAFNLWFERARAAGVLRPEQTRDQYLVEFMNACRKARTPLGESPAELAMRLAATEPPPPEAAAFETPEGKLLVALCWQLHRLAKGEPWFLASRTVARLTGRSHAAAATWLNALVAMNILEVVEEHTSSKATRYRYHETRKA
jgi:hypothetical protein